MRFQIGDIVHTNTDRYNITNPSTICEVLKVDYDDFHRERIEIRVKAWKPNEPRENERYVNRSMEEHETYLVSAKYFQLYKTPRKITI